MPRALVLALVGALGIALVSAMPASPAAYRAGGRSGVSAARTDSTAYRLRLGAIAE